MEKHSRRKLQKKKQERPLVTKNTDRSAATDSMTREEIEEDRGEEVEPRSRVKRKKDFYIESCSKKQERDVHGREKAGERI